MTRVLTCGVAAAALLGSTAAAQRFVGPGSTPQGDFLRGAGIAAWGQGLYNLNTAQAERIHLGSEIILNDYVAAVHEHELQEKSRIRLADFARHKKVWAEGQERVLNAPNEFDIRNGDNLNEAMAELNKGAKDPSALRRSPVLLPVDVVRRIPFKFAAEGAVVSMYRLMHKGTGAWPVAFQDKRFDADCAAYHSALCDALDQQIEGKVQSEAIARMEKAVKALQWRIDKEYGPRDGPRNPNLYWPALKHLDELRDTVKQFNSANIEAAVAELETYSGVTVDELRMFMIRHKLGFAPADRPEERTTYRELYAALRQQRDALGADR